MRRHSFIALLLLLTTAAWGTEQGDSVNLVPSFRGTAKALSVEIGGTNLIGLTYDSRFRGNRGWGYRVGLGYNRDVDKMRLAYSLADGSTEVRIHSTASGFGIPLEINYLAGRRLHQFEVGAGTTLGFYKEKYETSKLTASEEGEGSDRTTTVTYEEHSSEEKHFGWYVYGNVGYRFHTKRGFLLRLGMVGGCGGGEETPYRQSWSIRPYLSLGYTFPNAAIGQKTDVRKLHVPDSTRIRGYRGFGEVLGGSTGLPVLGITTIHGFRFSRQWFVGAGLGLTTEGVPVFADARFNLTKRQTAPVLDARLGYTLDYLDAPFYASIGFGVDHRFTRKLALSFMLNFLRMEGENGWTLQLGVEF